MNQLKPQPDRSVPEPGQQIHVLLVEDNPGDARLIEVMLEAVGSGEFRVQKVDRLETAMRVIEAGGIELVLCDLSLPDSQGLETFARLHAQAPHVPIIVLSGLNDAGVALQAVHDGAQDFLVKGQVAGESLMRSMRYAMERQRMSDQLAAYAQELRARNAQLEADFNMAREIQELFLPENYPALPPDVPPDQSAVELAHRYLPARAVGGDFFDVFPVSDTKLGLFLCDVMGHGMRAALVTAIMRGLVEELISSADNPALFMSDINRSLHAILRRTTDPFLATAFYVVMDARAGELRYSNAGHPSPLYISGDRARFLKEPQGRHGPALGLFGQPSYPCSSCAVQPGESLVLFTDGVHEAVDARSEEFGFDRLLQAVQACAMAPVEQVLDGILSAVNRFRGAQEFEDDVCLLGITLRKRL